jgi:hypothetical protein
MATPHFDERPQDGDALTNGRVTTRDGIDSDEDALNTAAVVSRVARTAGFTTEVVLANRPGVADKARAAARRAEVLVQTEVLEVSILVRFATPSDVAADTSVASLGAGSDPACMTPE